MFQKEKTVTLSTVHSALKIDKEVVNKSQEVKKCQKVSR